MVGGGWVMSRVRQNVFSSRQLIMLFTMLFWLGRLELDALVRLYGVSRHGFVLTYEYV